MFPNSTHIIPYWRCTSDGCPERAVWGQAWMPTFCDTHKHDNKLESLRVDRCLLCKRIFIVNKNKHCKPCSELVTEKEDQKPVEKPLEPPTHPNFTVSQYPVLRTAKSSPDVISSRRPSPTLDPDHIAKALRRSSALSLMSVRSNDSGISAASATSAASTGSARTRGSGSTMNLNLKLTKLQAQGELQLAVTSTKLKLKAAKATLAQYSPIEHTPSKMAAIEAVAQAEKEVEDACKAWCHAQRN